MRSGEIRTPLIGQLRRACSLELAVASALGPLLECQADSGLGGLVDAHRRDSRRHRERVPARLRAFGALPSPDGRAGARILAAARGFAGGRADLTEEERLAERGGDDATARVAREARADDQELARRLLRPRGASTPPEERAP